MKRWRIVVVAAMIATAFAACGFPDVTFTPELLADSGAHDARSDGPANEAGSGPSDAMVDAPVVDALPPPVEIEAGTVSDAETRDDAAVRLEAGADGAGCVDPSNPCDCDKDRHPHEGDSCVAPVGTEADCDDLDPLVHPGQFYVAASWQSPHTPEGDFDCNGTTEKQWTEGIPCNSLIGGNCTEGFEAADVPCGVSAKYNHCQALNLLGIGLVCSVKSYEMRVQGCK